MVKLSSSVMFPLSAATALPVIHIQWELAGRNSIALDTDYVVDLDGISK